MKRLLVTLALLLFASPLFAANTSISNGDSGSSVRTKLNTQLNQIFNVKQPPYNAVGDGTTDDRAAIQAAIDDANAAGGGTVYLPALSSNCYKTTAPLTFAGSVSKLVGILGERGFANSGSRICANFGGTSSNVSGAANNGSGAIRLTVASTASFNAGYYVRVASVGGTTEANGLQAITIIDGTHIDLVGSTFVHAYTSGGTVQNIGYVFDAISTGGSQTAAWFRGLNINNIHAAGGGIRWGDVTAGDISGGAINVGGIGFWSDGSYNITIQSMGFTGITGDELGAVIGQTSVRDSSFTGFGVAIQTHNIGTVILGNRFEVNDTAIVVGRALGVSSNSHAVLISGNSGERNNTQVYIQVGDGLLMSGNSWTGTVGVDGVTPPLYGTRVINCEACAFVGEEGSTQASVAGIDLSTTGGANITFISSRFLAGTGDPWKLPTGGSSLFTFINSNNPTGALLFNNLPTPIQGMSYDVTNCTIAGGAWGGTVTNGGGGGVPCKVYYNGTNWTAMAK